MNMKKLITTAFLMTLVSASYGQSIETIQYRSGSVYVGEIANGRRNGTGTLTTKDGTEIGRAHV